jgi:hypothetical protein
MNRPQLWKECIDGSIKRIPPGQEGSKWSTYQRLVSGNTVRVFQGWL